MRTFEVLASFDIDEFRPIDGATSTLPRRLISRLVPDDNGCWIWTGADDGKGYGVIGRGERGTGNIPTHAAMWQLIYGPAPDHLVYDHLCRVPLCANPRHGEYVTIGENTMRGNGVAPRHAARTHCLYGHLLDGSYLNGKSGRTVRYCKTCSRTKQSTHRQRQGASA